MMYNFLKIFLLSLQISSLFCGEQNHQDEPYLPFVLIKNKDTFLYPNTIGKGTYTPGKGFLGDTQFSTNGHHDQYFFCSPHSQEDHDKIELAESFIKNTPETKILGSRTTMNKNCLLSKTFQRNELLRCSSNAEPTIIMKLQKENGNLNELSCGPAHRKSGKIYEFVYEICPPLTFIERIRLYFSFWWSKYARELSKEIPFLYKIQTVYEICYDMKSGTTLYTKHQSSFGLLSDERLQHERNKKFEIMTYGFYHYAFPFNEEKEFYEKIENSPKDISLEDEDNEDSQNSTALLFKPQFLISPDDMPTALLRKPTFHYVNVKPMREDFIDLWSYIEETIRKNLTQDKIPYDIYTNALKLSKSQVHPKIPDLWIKIIHIDYKSSQRKSSGIAILLKNNQQPYDNIWLNFYCGSDLCERTKLEGELGKRFPQGRKHLLCCSLNQNIQDWFGLSLESEFTLKIPGLTNEEEDVPS